MPRLIYQNMWQIFDRLIKRYPWLGWFRLDLGVKRWIVLLLMGITALGVGIAFALVEIYQGGALPPALDLLTLQFLPRWARAILHAGVGLGALALSLWELSDTLLSPFS